jgi:hypothetical protein
VVDDAITVLSAAGLHAECPAAGKRAGSYEVFTKDQLQRFKRRARGTGSRRPCHRRTPQPGPERGHKYEHEPEENGVVINLANVVSMRVSKTDGAATGQYL